MTATAATLTSDERNLLRAVFAWWRAEHATAGHVFDGHLDPLATRYGYETADGRWRVEPDWPDRKIGIRRANMDQPRFSPGRWPTRPAWLPVVSVREAVDVLAAYGVIPARFSSAFHAGYAAALADTGQSPA